MKKFTALTIAFLGLGILACAGGSDEEGTTDGTTDEAKEETKETTDVDAKGAKLNSPWKEMNLPVGDGEVLVDTSEMLLVGWEGGSVTSMTQDFKARIIDAGWAVDEELVSGSQGSVNTAIIYKKDSTQIGLATGEEDGIIFAYMEDLGKVSDDDSAIRNPDKRSGIGSDARSRRGGGKSGGGKSGGGNSGGGIKIPGTPHTMPTGGGGRN